MTDNCTRLLSCPVCFTGLFDAGRSVQCAHGHSFDRARSGYLNLLASGHGRSAIQGDTREMLSARQRFLQRDHFLPLSDGINELVRDFCRTSSRPFALAEAGCGAGYYIGRLSQRLRPEFNDSLCSFGIDVSRDAVQLAAANWRDVVFLVNDLKHRLCLASGGIDVLLNIFAPRNAPEFARVLRPGGLLLVVVPGPGHLQELRARLPLLSVPPDKEERVLAGLAGNFRVVGRQEIICAAALESADVLDLLRMTPNAWHLDASALEQAAALGNVTVTMSFVILSVQRV